MYIHGEHTRKWFHRTLSIQGNDLNPGWAYAEMISLHPEHMRKSNMIFKNLELQALGTIRFRFLQKKLKKISCMCTFKRQDRILNGRVGKGYPKPDKLETGFGKQKDKVLNHQWWHLFLVSICYFFESSRFQIENCSTNHPPLMFSLSCSPYKCRRRGQKGALFLAGTNLQLHFCCGFCNC